MNVSQSFAEYLENVGIATLGQNLFIGQAPSTNKVPDSIYWIVVTGGSPTKTVTGGASKEYTISVYMRSRDYREVYQSMQELEVLLNCDACTELTGYETLDITAAVLSIDDDLDSEDRKVGVLQATITTYKSC